MNGNVLTPRVPSLPRRFVSSWLAGSATLLWVLLGFNGIWSFLRAFTGGADVLLLLAHSATGAVLLFGTLALQGFWQTNNDTLASVARAHVYIMWLAAIVTVYTSAYMLWLAGAMMLWLVAVNVVFCLIEMVIIGTAASVLKGRSMTTD